MAADEWFLYALVLARLAPLALALTVFSRGFVPAGVALSSALAWLCGLAPLAFTTHAAIPPGSLASGAPPAVFALMLLRELCIGGLFALAFALALYTVSWALAMSGALAPGPGRPALGIAYGLCAVWLVLSLGGARALFSGLAESFGDAALGARVLDARAFALGVARLGADALASAFGLALPLLASVWLLDASAALIARALAVRSAPPSPLRPILVFGAAALLLVPNASRAPELVRAGISTARALTRAVAR